MYVCGGGEEKKGRGYMGGGEKKKEIKEKRNGEWSLRVWWEKRGSGKERRKKNCGFICMFTLFGAKCRIVKIYLEDVYDIFFIINGLCISLLHTLYIFLYLFLLHCSIL